MIGDPHADGVTMGPLVSREQRDEVLRQVVALQAAGGRGSSSDRPTLPTCVRADGTTGAAPDGAFVSRRC